MRSAPELVLAGVVILVVIFLALNRTSTTPPMSPDPPVSDPRLTPTSQNSGRYPGN